MFSSPFAPVFLLVLLVGSSASAQPRLPDCLAASPHLELPTESGDAPPSVCIRPETGTSFRFDADLLAGGVTVQARERFVDVALGARTMLVLPPARSQPGERFRVEVRFADGVAPERVTFDLVVHPAWAAREVTVARHAHSLMQDACLQRCEPVLERVRQEAPGPGLVRLMAMGMLAPNGDWGAAQNMTKTSLPGPGNALWVPKVLSYRFTPPSEDDLSPVVHVAVALQLINPNPEPWTPGRATLAVKGQEPRDVRVWPRVPFLPGKPSQWLMVEAELPRDEARGTYSLDLLDESGGRPVSLGHVTFPQLPAQVLRD